MRRSKVFSHSSLLGGRAFGPPLCGGTPPATPPLKTRLTSRPAVIPPSCQSAPLSVRPAVDPPSCRPAQLSTRPAVIPPPTSLSPHPTSPQYITAHLPNPMNNSSDNGHPKIWARPTTPVHWHNRLSCAKIIACITRSGHPQTGAEHKDGAPHIHEQAQSEQQQSRDPDIHCALNWHNGRRAGTLWQKLSSPPQATINAWPTFH